MNFQYGRREFIRKISYASAGVLLGSPIFSMSNCKFRQGDVRPNIVLILADDLGYSDIGCYGGEIDTPNLDSLAYNGVRFSLFYNSARCCPSRASLLTGLYPHQTGVGDMERDEGLDGYRGDLNKHCVTIAEVLKQAGYRNYACGKWHVTRFTEGPKHNWPLQRGFDRYFGTLWGGGSYFAPYQLVLDNDYISVDYDGFYYTNAITDYAVKFIHEHIKNYPDRPFFLYVAFTSPHWPLHALEEDIKRFKGRYDQGWDYLRGERYKRMIQMGILNPKWKLTPRDPQVPPWAEADNKAWQVRRMEVYAAQVFRMDQGIGKLVAELREGGVLDNTLIFFLSDNGGCSEELTDRKGWRNLILNYLKVGWQYPPEANPIKIGNDPNVMPGNQFTFQSYGIPWANVSNTPFRLYKSWTHQGGIATPLIMHWPHRIKTKNKIINQPGHITDLMATCVEVSGATYPRELNGQFIIPMEGKSLIPALEGKPTEREAIYFEHEKSRAVIAGKLKLVAREKDGPWELYDMENDATETNNLANQCPDLAEKMAEMWKSWAIRTKVLPWPQE